ncbi:GATOR1 complex protein NPRL3 [Hippocampus comes]|uniref:GATOR1 complex protein NPRL3 n=1 Tax=Hippocampus comes TaxID=109280 RepID=UPI00094F3616|nr:PREDICTED: nitrogen permease regulator 3-like protein [Hippocampus comes]
MMLNPSGGGGSADDQRKSAVTQPRISLYREPRCGHKTSPISVILVSSGSRGNKLLFRYPFQRTAECASSHAAKQRNRYAQNTTAEVEDHDGDSRESSSLTDEQLVAGFSDSILATILATKSDMCGKKFELKIDDVRFVGHPTLLQHPPIIQVGQQFTSSALCWPFVSTSMTFFFCFVFLTTILAANADPSVISCMQNLSRRIAIALQHEERRCQYLTREAKLMLAVQDEITTVTEMSPQSPFRQILPKCKLAKDLKEAYDSLCTTGVVRLHINNWLEVSFCLPHKIHRIGGNYIPPEALERSLKAIRPYHALLLLESEKALLGQLPVDCSPAMMRLIKTCSAVKNLQQLAQDTDLALLQICQIAAHLVYWGKAIIIYPLCENNVYMLSPHANIYLFSPQAEQFAQQFPGHDLPSTLAKFSLPVSLAEFRNPLEAPAQEAQLIQMVVWMLQRRLLIQLHTFVCLMVPPAEDEPAYRDDALKPCRLLHYFRGHHHLEEIMYNENMRRSQLKTLLDKFRSVLVVTNHEDPIISIFQSPQV